MEGYIRAMIRMGLPPEDVLIVEDSVRGVEAARSTGAHLWQVKDAQDVTIPGFKSALANLFGGDYLKTLMLGSLDANK